MNGWDQFSGRRDSTTPPPAAYTGLAFGGAGSDFGASPPPNYSARVGLAGLDSSGNVAGGGGGNADRRPIPPVGLAGMPSFAAGGAIDEDTGSVNPMMNTMGSQLQFDLNGALGVLKGVLDYGRQQHGLGGGGQQEAANMPAKPFSETPKPQPMMPPSSLPYGPGEKPFGKRSENDPNEPEPDGDEDDQGAIDVAGVMPSVPFNQSPNMPRPMPGPLPPTSNPFGKRAEAEPDNDEAGAIDTEENA